MRLRRHPAGTTIAAAASLIASPTKKGKSPESKVLDFGLFPFLIGDAIKLAAAAIVVPAGWRLSRTR